MIEGGIDVEKKEATEEGWSPIAQKYVTKFSDIIILSLLREQPMHGHAIRKRINERFGVNLSPSYVYPLLHSFKDQGLVNSNLLSTAPGKPIIYTLTSKGMYTSENLISEFISVQETIFQKSEEEPKK